MEKKQLTGLIYGATGAIGKLLVQQLVSSNQWKKVIVVGRSSLPQWSSLGEKLEIQKINMDQLKDTQKWKYQNIDSVFCCLGSQTKHGDETFIKIDKTYPIQIADIAKRNGIKHYSLVSSMGADASSWFLYPRTKGQVEDQLSKKEFPVLSIFRPGLLKNRSDARFIQKIAGYLPLVPKIQSSQLAKVLRLEAERNHNQGYSKGPMKLYENKNILQML